MTTTDSERQKAERLNTQRWENEGGQMIENGNSIPDQSTIQRLPIHARRHVSSLQWNERFVIEPFQQSTGLLQQNSIAKGKRNE